VHRRLVLALAVLSCGTQYPSQRPTRDARFGLLGGEGSAPDALALCRDWKGVAGKRDPYAMSHVSFAEVAPEVSCYTRVAQQGRSMFVGHVPDGCGGPTAAEREAMRATAARLESAVLSSGRSTLFPCDLTARQRTAAARHNALVLRRLAGREGTFPYAAVVVPGYGEPAQAETSVADWLPGDSCHDPDPADIAAFGSMMERTRRASDALAAGVAPVAIVSGGAVHSRMIEAFAMLYLLQCLPDRVADSVLLEPCAEHTHTNLRNAGRWLVAMGARTAYLVTDEGMQADYFQDETAFDLIGGSIDQRSLRDWGYVIGSWRQASVGPDTPTGFWFTPYRFWAEPGHVGGRPPPQAPGAGLGSVTCVERGR
jgi:hypothetical protein